MRSRIGALSILMVAAALPDSRSYRAGVDSIRPPKSRAESESRRIADTAPLVASSVTLTLRLPMNGGPPGSRPASKAIVVLPVFIVIAAPLAASTMPFSMRIDEPRYSTGTEPLTSPVSVACPDAVESRSSGTLSSSSTKAVRLFLRLYSTSGVEALTPNSSTEQSLNFSVQGLRWSRCRPKVASKFESGVLALPEKSDLALKRAGCCTQLRERVSSTLYEISSRRSFPVSACPRLTSTATESGTAVGRRPSASRKSIRARRLGFAWRKRISDGICRTETSSASS